MKNMRVVIMALAVVAFLGAVAYVVLSRSSATNTPDSAIATPTTTGSNQPLPGDATVSVGTTPTREIVIEGSEYKFSPSEVRVKKGETVKLTLKNVGRMPHDWKVEGVGGLSIDLTNPAGTNSITVTPSQKGTFTTFCSVGSHRQLGMVGKLIVE